MALAIALGADRAVAVEEIWVSYESVDALQRTLTESVFQYAADKKKAAGRALGTLVEIVTFHTLRTWNLRDNIVIERSVPEFGNPDIVHNVEFALHPVKTRKTLDITGLSLPITPAKIKRHLSILFTAGVKATPILTTDSLKRNAAVLVENENRSCHCEHGLVRRLPLHSHGLRART